MAVQRVLVYLAATAFLFQLAMAANIIVGAPNGSWDSRTNLDAWDDSQNFIVGDSLIFQYTSNHDVLEVTEANYDACTTSNPIDTHTGGNTVIALSSPGTRYFICGTPGHCSQGMKITVDVTAAATPGTPSTPSTPSTPGTPSTPDVPSADSPGSSPPPPPPRSSNGDNLKTCLTVGLGLMLMMVLAL